MFSLPNLHTFFHHKYSNLMKFLHFSCFHQRFHRLLKLIIIIQPTWHFCLEDFQTKIVESFMWKTATPRIRLMHSKINAESIRKWIFFDTSTWEIIIEYNQKWGSALWMKMDFRNIHRVNAWYSILLRRITS